MVYRSLLVHLGSDPRCDARVALAARLARDHDSHLVGLAPTGWLDIPVQVEFASAFGDSSTLAWEAMRRQAEVNAERFREQCQPLGLKSFEAVVDEAEEARSVIRHGHCSDLLLVGQADPTRPGHAAESGFVEQVVLQSGRPTLMLPYSGSFENVGQRILIAWDDSREAARAVADAMPLLTGAHEVHLIAMQDGADRPPLLEPRWLAAASQWLVWHGVDAQVHSEVTEIGLGEALLSRAADLGSDLIVMGAYGHARWSERVLGGMTRSLLAHMTVPVLMSH